MKGLLLLVFILLAGHMDQVFTYLPDELDCPPPQLLHQYRSLKVKFLPGTSMRAMLTVPPGFTVNWSSISGAGMGAFTTTLIKKHTFLGECEGILKTLQHQSDNQYTADYSWKITKDGKMTSYVDSFDENYASWLRYVNTARFHSEQNVDVLMCQGRVYYKTLYDLLPGTELLVFYGAGYLGGLGITMENYLDSEESKAWKLLANTTCR